MNFLFKSPQYKKTLQVFLIILFCLIIYIPSLGNGYIWDDDLNVYKNQWVQKTDGLWNIWFSAKIYQYYPVDFTTFWVEHKLWGLNPFGYHLTNLLIHILNALLLFWVISKLYPRLAFIAALFFAVHPIQVETVAWITERKNLLSLFFFLLAVLAYLRFDRARVIKYYWLAVAMFILALLSKPVAVSFIFIPILYKWWKDGRVSFREIRLSAPLLAAGLIAAFYTLYLELYNVGARGQAFNLNFLERFILSGKIIFFYIYKICLPFKFMFFYPRWTVNAMVWWQWLFPAAVMLTIGALVYYRKKTGRGALALFIFYIISIFPVLGFINVYGMKFSYVADHFSYFSTPVILLLLCSGTTYFFDKVRHNFHLLSPVAYRTLKLCFLIFAVIYMCAKSSALTRNYKDEFTLWSNLIRHNPGAWIAYNNLGNLYRVMDKSDEALALYNKAIELKPDYVDAYNNLANIYGERGKSDEALALYKKVIAENPNYAIAYYNLGVFYNKMGKPEEAVALYKKAIAIDPYYADAYYNLGVFYDRTGKKEDAILLYKKAIESDPAYADAYSNLANLYSGMGKTEEAFALYKKAVAANSGSALAYYNLAVFYEQKGGKREALALYKKAIAIDPYYADAYNNLGNIYAGMRKNEEAIKVYKKALEIYPDYAILHLNLSIAYFSIKEYDLALKHCDRAIELGYKIPSQFVNLLRPYRK